MGARRISAAYACAGLLLAGLLVLASGAEDAEGGPRCAGKKATIVGSNGADEISVVGELGPKTTVRLDGGEGSDVILGGPGDEMLEAGYDDASVDTPRHDLHSPDLLNGRGGDDVVSSLYFGPDVLRGGEGSDQMISDACTGNTIDGGPGGSDKLS